MEKEDQKRQAGRGAADLVKDGMVVGLGTGSTVRHTILRLGERVAEGLRITGIPTSRQSEELARQLRIPLSDLDAHPDVDLTIDGADEVDPKLRLIKGGGGALTREKVVAAASRRMVVVADETKEVARLGTTFALPIEVLEMAKTPLTRRIGGLGASVRLRMVGSGPFRTDNGNVILDARWPEIVDPEGLEEQLECMAGVVTSGLFLGLCHEAHVATATGVRVRRAEKT